MRLVIDGREVSLPPNRTFLQSVQREIVRNRFSGDPEDVRQQLHRCLVGTARTRLRFNTICPRRQRDMINRRQRRAQGAGIQLWNIVTPFGCDYLYRKW